MEILYWFWLLIKYNTEVIKALIRYGCDLNIVGDICTDFDEAHTAISLAQRKAIPHLLKMLILAGASLSSIDLTYFSRRIQHEQKADRIRECVEICQEAWTNCKSLKHLCRLQIRAQLKTNIPGKLNSLETILPTIIFFSFFLSSNTAGTSTS